MEKYIIPPQLPERSYEVSEGIEMGMIDGTGEYDMDTFRGKDRVGHVEM
jgi:hypothetical protein